MTAATDWKQASSSAGWMPNPACWDRMSLGSAASASRVGRSSPLPVSPLPVSPSRVCTARRPVRLGRTGPAGRRTTGATPHRKSGWGAQPAIRRGHGAPNCCPCRQQSGLPPRADAFPVDVGLHGEFCCTEALRCGGGDFGVLIEQHQLLELDIHTSLPNPGCLRRPIPLQPRPFRGRQHPDRQPLLALAVGQPRQLCGADVVLPDVALRLLGQPHAARRAGGAPARCTHRAAVVLRPRLPEEEVAVSPRRQRCVEVRSDTGRRNRPRRRRCVDPRTAAGHAAAVAPGMPAWWVEMPAAWAVCSTARVSRGCGAELAEHPVSVVQGGLDRRREAHRLRRLSTQ